MRTTLLAIACGLALTLPSHAHDASPTLWQIGQTDGGCRVNPIYEIGSPLYPKVVLHPSKEHYGGKTFTIEARDASRANSYIQSATFNGQPLNRWWIRQKDLLNGGHLVLELGPTPNTEWTRGCPLPD